jgi:MFS family permease
VGAPPDRDPRFLTFLGGTAMADIGDQAWIVILAYAAAQSGHPLTATLTVAAGTVPRAILDLIGGSVADRLPTRPLLVVAALGRVLALALGLLALVELPGRTVPIMVLVAVLFGAADAVHKPAVGTFPRQVVAVTQLVRAASLRQLVARVALLVGPALAGVVLAAGKVPGAVAGLVGVFAVAAVLLSLVRPRYRREFAPRQSVVASTREVVGYLRQDAPARALVYTMIGLNFFVIPVINAGIAIRVHQEGWGASTLGVLMASIGFGAVAGTLVTLRIRPRYPMRFALILLVLQGIALALAGVLPVVGAGISLGLVGLTAGLSSPMLGGTTQAIVRQNYLGRIYSLYGLADDALIPFALVGYGAVAGAVGVRLTTVLCGVGMAVLMGTALLRRPLRMLRLDEPEAVDPVVEESLDPVQDPVPDPRTRPDGEPVRGSVDGPAGDQVASPAEPGDGATGRAREGVDAEAPGGPDADGRGIGPVSADPRTEPHTRPRSESPTESRTGRTAPGPARRRSQRTSRAIG